jgi:D-alanyl-lipoteichoic acid acyltransferase DltB (MBOAT superfamily)
VVIADRLSVYVNTVYNNPDNMYGVPIWTATFFFAFQIYCDFSGYTDIARGTARMFGFELIENFKMPYIADSFHDFWKRWHISLTSWFRDYLYIPLGGNRVAKPRWLTNIFLVFLISGLWHGANWTYVIWGALHGLLQIIELLTIPLRNRFYNLLIFKSVAPLVRCLHILFVFFVVCFAWLFFRANSLADAVTLLHHAVVFPNWNINVQGGLSDMQLMLAFGLVGFLYFAEIFNLYFPFKNLLKRSPLPVRWAFYIFAVFFILLFGVYSDIASFIYFQF